MAVAIRTLLVCLILPACRELSHHSTHDDSVALETYLADTQGLGVDMSSLILMADMVVVAHIGFEDVLVVDFVDGLVASKDYYAVDADKGCKVLVVEDLKAAG